MRLKQLDIFAFKSFMERTSLSFPPGLSAIVGPNGCGKSNLIDAVRWAIGEQSARSLRGRLMEDVIFAGTNGRRALGLAEVSLTLEANGRPASEPFGDAAEVTITRRLHRSGESEFLINRRPCRLKDIAHIFLGTGLGGRGYGVIEQGKIEQLVEARPEERRALVEEAAGVSRYRVQRAEALRKLEAAEANLARLGDIVGEIRRQLAGLERQRRQAERHARLRDSLRAVELAQAGRDYLTALAGLERAQAAEQEAARREAEAQAARAGLGAERTRLEAELSAAAARREAAGERLAAARGEAAGHQARVQALEGELNLLGREGRRLSEAAEGAGRRGAEAAAGLERCQEAKRAAAEERARLREEAETLPGRAEEAAAGLETLRAAADALKGALVGALAARAEADNALRGLAARQAELASRFLRQEREAEAARAAARGCEEREGAARAGLAEVAAGLAAKRAEEEAAEAEARQARGGCEGLRQKLAARRAEHEGLSARLGHLEGLCASARGEAAEGLLAAARELGAEHFPLAEALEIDEAAYEPALAAALGERLRAVVFARADDARRALELFRRRGRGVALALALDRRGEAGHNGEGLPGFEPRGAARLAAALEGVHLAGDLAEALEADAGACALTRDGAALLPGGWLAATGGGGQGSQLLGWQRELKTLARRAAALKSDIEAGEAGLARGQAAAAAAEARHERAKAGATELAATQERLEAEGRAAAQQLATGRERLRLLDLEAERDRQAAAEVEAQAAEALGRAQAAAKALADHEAHQKEEQKRIRAAEGRQRELGERLSRVRSALAVLSEREVAVSAEAERLRREQAEAQAQAKTLGAEAEQAGRREAEIQTRLEQARREAAGLGEGLAALEAERAAAEQEAEGARAALGRLTAQLAELSAELERLRAGASEARLARSEMGLRLEAAADRARELHQVEMDPEGAGRLAGALPPEADCAAEARRLRESLLRLGEVNPAAPREYEEVAARLEETVAQEADVAGSIATLKRTLGHIDESCRKQFLATFEALDEKIAHVFATLFGGGTARLELVGEDPLEAGVDIVAQPPGKRLAHLSLLSGGEKAMAATALLFALHLLRPSPFYLLDELDAALDDANVERLNRLLQELAEQSQIIVVTHNKRTLEMADTLYGVTMEEPGVSKLVSVRLSELSQAEGQS